MKPLPTIAWSLGYAGLLPFFFLLLVIVLQPPMPMTTEQAGSWILSYAAVIISFLGAVHWGVALGMQDRIPPPVRDRLLLYSVVPPLLAWQMVLLPLQPALFGMVLLVVLAYIADRLFLFRLLNSAYRILRLHLTLAVSISLILTGLAIQ